jgi:drug/metabolite transporter (DMT)-like permease
MRNRLGVRLLIAVFAALFYGISDFLAGLCARTARSVMGVAFVVQIAAVIPALAFALARPAPLTVGALAWGTLAGVGIAAGSAALYLGLARGAMGVVAPTSAIVSAAVPVLLSVALREAFGAAALIGICLAVPALVMVAAPTERMQESQDPGWRLADLGYGAAAGVGIGTSYVAYGALHGSGFWPVPISLALSAVIFGAVLLRWGSRDSFVLNWRVGVAAGASLGLACIVFRLSVSQHSVAISSVVTSLYPAVTVVLAAGVLKERIGVVRGLGLVGALVSIALVTYG